jgi:FkbM family methyltransferase
MVIELGPVGARYRIHDPGGGGRIAKMIRGGQPYEVDVLADMAALDLAGTAVDVGANIGNHTLWLAAVCGLRVEAFEPREEQLAKMRANVALNGFGGRVRVHPVALGAAAGTAKQLSKGRLNPAAAGAVEVRTLDSYQLTDVTLVKIDVEGMEPAVIRGGLATIERCRPTIYAEAWDDTYSDATGKLLEPLGYRRVRRFRWHQQRWDPR